MNGSRFVVGLNETVCSESILKIKSLLKDDKDADGEIKISCPGIIKLKTDNDSLGISLDTLMLLSNIRKVAKHVAG